jgi:hypothetical protein
VAVAQRPHDCGEPSLRSPPPATRCPRATDARDGMTTS